LGIFKIEMCWALVACNPSYSEGKDQEVLQLKPAEANSSGDSIMKIPNTKKGSGGMTEVVEYLPSKCEALSLNPSNTKKKFFF
jgi:hypothetical protein